MAQTDKQLNLRFDPIPFLLSPRQPAWVKLQTHLRILGAAADDPHVAQWRDRRDSSSAVKRIRQKQGPEGWFPCMPWMHIHKYYFHELVEMGYGMEDDTVRRAAANLLDYQFPDGGYMHPTGRRVNTPDARVGWAACMTGYVTKALLDLGLGHHPCVVKALEVLRTRQNVDGGWMCRDGPCVDERNCIIAGTPWALASLVQAGMVRRDHAVGKKAIDLFSRFKTDICRHGYQHDRCYRCDETLVLPSLLGLGLSTKHPLVQDLRKSLLEKQQPDGSWHFRGKRSGWYTLEAVKAVNISS